MPPTHRPQAGFAIVPILLALALAGALGYGVYAYFTGTLKSQTTLQQVGADTDQLRQMMQIIATQLADTDNDGTYEAPPFAPGGGPSDGGIIPANIPGAKSDPWGTPFGYCAWNHGTNHAASAGQLAGQAGNFAALPLFALISAGPDKLFETSCADVLAGITKGDDRVKSYTYAEAMLAASLWQQNSNGSIYYGTTNPAANVGIGTAAPSQRLDVAGNALIEGQLHLAGTNIVDDKNNLQIAPQSPSTWEFLSDNGLLLADRSGNLRGWLYTQANGTTPSIGLLNNAGGWSLQAFNGGVNLYGNVTIENNALLSWGGAYIRPSTGTYGALDIGGNTNGYAGIHFTATNNYFMWSSQYQGAYNGSSWQWLWNYGTLTAQGAVYASAFYYNSDRRLKTDVKPLSDTLGKIVQLRPVAFKWKADGRRDVGFIAQDVEKIYPELVKTRETDGVKTLAYGNLIAPAIKAIQELKQEVDDLRAENAALATRLEHLEAAAIH